MYRNAELAWNLGSSNVDWELWDEEAYDRSRVLMYADEQKPYSPSASDIEVLASVPKDAILPDCFTKDNVKYTDFRANYSKAKYKLSCQWDDQFRQCRVYILDPRSVYVAAKQSEDYAKIFKDESERQARAYADKYTAWELLRLDPHAWMHTLELTKGQLAYGLPNFEQYGAALLERFRWAKQKQINARRLVLRSQALNHEILRFSPFDLSQEGELKYGFRSLPVVRLARSINAQMIYDSGYPGDLPMLFKGQKEKEKLVRVLSRADKLPKASDGLIFDLPSKNSQPIQLAGIAAGLCNEMYTSDKHRPDLPKKFESVWLNGQLM
jgi:hypothetical protein